MATAKQIKRWQRFPEVGCICCRRLGTHNPETEVHHLLEGGRRAGHDKTIPLCVWHHRGVGFRYGDKGRDMGPSWAHGSKPFRAMFGTDDELLAEVNKYLEEFQC